MPPKKNAKGSGPSKKSETKAKQKLVEDKTFGLKNKNKSAKVNKYVQQVEKQVMVGGKSKAQRQEEDRKRTQEQKKHEEKKKQEEFAAMFKPTIVQKVPFGVNPKTVMCEFFKAGACTKGSKCKFSHDSAVERKGNKLDVYTDKRDEDTMDKWNDKKLEEVVLSKHGNPKTTTNIVCKYFLEAIEDKKYGWFWECPNGGDKCQYRHALPPGFVLKKDQKKDAQTTEISLEEFLETERHKLGSNLTQVTLESFTKWKQARQLKKEEEEMNDRKAKEKAFKAGKVSNMSGRDYFEFNPELEQPAEEGAEEEFDFSVYRNQDGGYQRDRDGFGMDKLKIEAE